MHMLQKNSFHHCIIIQLHSLLALSINHYCAVDAFLQSMTYLLMELELWPSTTCPNRAL